MCWEGLTGPQREGFASAFCCALNKAEGWWSFIVDSSTMKTNLPAKKSLSRVPRTTSRTSLSRRGAASAAKTPSIRSRRSGPTPLGRRGLKPVVPGMGRAVVRPSVLGAVEVPRLFPATADVPSGKEVTAPGADRTLSRWDENSSLRLYLRDAVETPLLTPAEEIQLAHRIQAGDPAAREHMIKANLRLVVKIAREYEDYGLPLLDLVNEGNIGLMRAVERFDPTRGAKLSTYAAWWIKQAIKRALSNQVKSIRLPIHLVQQISQLRRAESAFEAKHGRPGRDSELAVVLGVGEDDILHWRESATVGTTSLEAPLGTDPDAGCVADLVADDNAEMPWNGVSKETNAELIRQLVGTLNSREQRILQERFALDGGEPRTLEEIGIDFGLTRERIRQLEAVALKKLRDRIETRERMANP